MSKNFSKLPTFDTDSGEELNEQQEQVLQLVQEGKNVCILGSAGSGKSFLLKRIISSLESKYSNYDNGLYITSLTGKTATSIKGRTLHSFSGIGDRGEDHLRFLLLRISKNRASWNRWARCEVLIIDEVSMLSSSLFDKLDRIAKTIKGNDKPFGGIQLICSGDFFQLSPVEKYRWFRKNKNWSFNANSWFQCFPLEQTIELVSVYRQKDSKLLEVLQNIRNSSKISASDMKFILGLKRTPKWPKDGIIPVRICSTNKEADKINQKELKKIKSHSYTYRASSEGKKSALRDMEYSSLSPNELVLKKGTQVILTKNIFNPNYSLVNGAQGVVVDFEKNKMGFKVPVVQFSNGEEVSIGLETWNFTEWVSKNEETDEVVVATRSQIPLALSWAITIHKSQGQTIERLIIDCKKMWLDGHFYVAMSRATNSKYLQILNFKKEKIKMCNKVKEFYQSLRKNASTFINVEF